MNATTPTGHTVEVTPTGYRLGDTLYIYDAITNEPLSYDNGHWYVESNHNANDNADKYAAHIQPPVRNLNDWEDSADDQLLKVYGLRLGPLHDWNEYDLIEE